ncbi:MAG: hypothetical protein ABI145_13620 [Steroidobacteraceae bacterium]
MRRPLRGGNGSPYGSGPSHCYATKGSGTWYENHPERYALGRSLPATGLTGVNAGDVLPAAPEGQASTYAEVDFPVAQYQGYVRATASYLGDEWTDFEHNGTKFGGFATEGLRGGVNFGSYEVVAFINNLSNSQGATGALDAQLAGPVILNNQLLFRVRPRAVGLTLRAKF